MFARWKSIPYRYMEPFSPKPGTLSGLCKTLSHYPHRALTGPASRELKPGTLSGLCNTFTVPPQNLR